MLLIELAFPAGRYHATAWGRHVNEGVAEWPPSPYRLVRALYDAWKRKRPTWEEPRVQRLLSAISSSAPSYFLPPATASHTRSFLSKNEEDPQSRTLIFDGFVVLSPRAAVLIGWPDIFLDAAAAEDLDELLSLLNYLGRSESWIQARLLRGVAVGDWNCLPQVAITDSGEGDIIPVAVPVPESQYQPVKSGNGRAAKDIDWMEALATYTDVVLKSGWSHPPAMTYVHYVRSSDCFAQGENSSNRGRHSPVSSVLYAFDSKVLPRVTGVLKIAESARTRLMGIHKKLAGGPENVSPKFSGKDAAGERLRGHQHAFILPIDKDEDGRLDHLLIYCKTPFDAQEVRALDELKGIRFMGGTRELPCVPVQWNVPRSRSRSLVSCTPFVPERHFKPKREDFAAFLQAEVARECANHGLPQPISIEGVSELLVNGSRAIRWFEFKRNREDDPVRSGFGLRIEFAEDVDVPLTLGYGCHFGLGQLSPPK